MKKSLLVLLFAVLATTGVFAQNVTLRAGVYGEPGDIYEFVVRPNTNYNAQQNRYTSQSGYYTIVFYMLDADPDFLTYIEVGQIRGNQIQTRVVYYDPYFPLYSDYMGLTEVYTIINSESLRDSEGTLYVWRRAYDGAQQTTQPSSSSGGQTGGSSTQAGTQSNPISLTNWDFVTDTITSTASGAAIWYSFNVESGGIYEIRWTDADSPFGSSAYLDIMVDASYQNGPSIFTRADSGNRSRFTADRNGTVLVKVYPYNSGNTGLFGIYFYRDIGF
ncbi:MAG: hypothetical protein LBQ94_08200 [Treponema sp.]|nr:hypothetical protein [Treponema sp.]